MSQVIQPRFTMTLQQYQSFKVVGGAKWLMEILDAIPKERPELFMKLPYSKRLIARDTRPRKMVAEIFGVGENHVQYLRKLHKEGIL